MPRAPGADGHFAFDGKRLERRDGRPATLLAAGMLRVDRRMREAAKASLAEERGNWLNLDPVRGEGDDQLAAFRLRRHEQAHRAVARRLRLDERDQFRHHRHKRSGSRPRQ